MEDNEIIKLFWRRSEEAVRAVDKKYGNYCTHISMNILFDPMDAEECVSDTFLHAWNAIPPEKPGVLSTWLGRMTRNLSIDKYRKRVAAKRGGQNIEMLLSELESAIPAGTMVEQQVEDRQTAALISEFLQSCSTENRIIFTRRYFYGDPISEIAKHYEVSESKVKSSLFRMRGALKIHLEKEGVAI